MISSEEEREHVNNSYKDCLGDVYDVYLPKGIAIIS